MLPITWQLVREMSTARIAWRHEGWTPGPVPGSSPKITCGDVLDRLPIYDKIEPIKLVDRSEMEAFVSTPMPDGAQMIQRN